MAVFVQKSSLGCAFLCEECAKCCLWISDCFFPFFYRVLLLSNGTLLITQVKPRNTGTYKCVGRGLRGSQVTLEASLLIAGTSNTYTHTKLECKQLENPVILKSEWNGLHMNTALHLSCSNPPSLPPSSSSFCRFHLVPRSLR